jgi:hypothetical protein
MSPSDYHQEYQPRKSSNITRGQIWVKQIILQYDSGKSQTKNRFKKTLTSPKIVPSKTLGLKLQKATQEAEKLIIN